MTTPERTTDMSDNTNERAYYADSPWTWRERLGLRLFPSEPCPVPEAPATWADCVTVTTVVTMSWLARVMAFISGRVKVQTRTVTEHVVGQSVTASVGYPVWRR